MFFEQFLSRQLGHPKGIFSGLVAIFMNRVTTHINDVTMQLLEIKPTDRVLDIGFGGGAAIKKMTKLVPDGLVMGIEVSQAMLRRGREKFRKLISQGKVDLKEGSAAKIPYENGWFDKIGAVNTIYFWPDPAAGLEEVFRVMKEQGRLVITYFTKEMFHSTRYGFTFYSEQHLRDLLEKAGFVDIQIKYREHPRFATAFIVANKPKK